MKITTKKVIQSFIIVPVLATTLSMNTFTASINEAVSRKLVVQTVTQTPEEIALQTDRQVKAAKIDAYYTKYDMPLAGNGMQMVLAAEKNGIDWRLIPAIAVRESSGGKNDCKNNPYGYGSCKIGYKDYSEATEAVAASIGGNNPKTAHYYKGKDTVGILKTYNSVIPTYTKEVISIMNKIEKTEA